MRAEFVPILTEDFGKTGMHKNRTVMELHSPEGEVLPIVIPPGVPSVTYLNEHVIWTVGHMRWTISIEEYNALTQVTDRTIGAGRANASPVGTSFELDETLPPEVPGS